MMDEREAAAHHRARPRQMAGNAVAILLRPVLGDAPQDCNKLDVRTL